MYYNILYLHLVVIGRASKKTFLCLEFLTAMSFFMKGLAVIESSVSTYCIFYSLSLSWGWNKGFILESAEASKMSFVPLLAVTHHITSTLSVDYPKLCCWPWRQLNLVIAYAPTSPQQKAFWSFYHGSTLIVLVALEWEQTQKGDHSSHSHNYKKIRGIAQIHCMCTTGEACRVGVLYWTNKCHAKVLRGFLCKRCLYLLMECMKKFNTYVFLNLF